MIEKQLYSTMMMMMAIVIIIIIIIIDARISVCVCSLAEVNICLGQNRPRKKT